MASQNTEFTRKLRAAVKAKLEEFGLDVDEELPDYVMIMVGNKKDKSRMKADLKLFLGENTSLFVDWLFGFFQKVKNVTSNTVSIPSSSSSGNSFAVKPTQDEVLSNTKLSPSFIHKDKHSKDIKKHSDKSAGTDLGEKVRQKSKNKNSKSKHNDESLKLKTSSKKKQVKEKQNTKTSSKSSNKTRDHEHNEKAPVVTSHEDVFDSKHKRIKTQKQSNLTPNSTDRVLASKISDGKKTRNLSPVAVEKVTRTTSILKHARDKSVLSGNYQEKSFESPVKETKHNKNAEEQKLSSTKKQRTIVFGSTNNADVGVELDDDEEEEEEDLPKRTVCSKVVVQHNLDPQSPKINSKIVVLRKVNEAQAKESKGSSSIFKRAISDAASVSAGYGVSGINQRSVRNGLTVEKDRRDVRLNYNSGIEQEGEKRALKRSSDELLVGQKCLQRIIVTVNSNPLDNVDQGGVAKKWTKIRLLGDDDSGVVNTTEKVVDAETRTRKIPKRGNLFEAATAALTQDKKLVVSPNDNDDDGENGDTNSPLKSQLQKFNSQVVPLKRKRIVYDENEQQITFNETALSKRQKVNDVIKEDEDADVIQRRVLLAELKQKRQPMNLTRAFLKLSGINPKMINLGKSAIDEGKPFDKHDVYEVDDGVLEENANTLRNEIENKLLKGKKKIDDIVNSISSSPLWNGKISLEIESSDDEAEIDAVLATAEAVRSATRQIEQCDALPPTAALSRPNKIVDGTATDNSFATLGYNPALYQSSFVPPVRLENGNSKMNERCRFWPDCRNEDVCPFHHPSKPCATFPNCWYGEKCLFIHPSCKFMLNCVKPKCPYTHYKPSATNSMGVLSIANKTNTLLSESKAPEIIPSSENLTACAMESSDISLASVAPLIPLSQLSPPAKPTGLTSTSTIACRYGGRCQNLKCFYKHPPMCRFGAGCAKQGCYFLHRTASSLSKVYNVSASENPIS